MVCPLCRNDTRIQDSGIVVEGDTSADEKTIVYDVQSVICVNPRCQNNGKEIDRIKHILYER